MADASVIIVTRNRREQVRRAIASALAQSGNPEVIVVDDASEDGTADAVRAEFPAVRVHRSEQRRGLVVQRNVAVEMSTAPVVFSIDDDAEFADPQTVQSTLSLFDEPRVGAVSVPFVNCDGKGNELRLIPTVPDDGKLWLSNTFVGTAFAVRRDVFLRLGGFQGLLFHWAEEGEYTLRLIGAGYVVAISGRGMIRHYPGGTGKYPRQVTRYIYRNGIFVLWLDAPTLLMPLLIVGRVAQYLLVDGLLRPKNLPAVLEGFCMAIKAMLSTWRIRTPLSMGAYRTWLRIRRERPIEFSRIANELPPIKWLKNG